MREGESPAVTTPQNKGGNTMETKILHDDGMVEVIAVYEHSKLKYTRTVIRDPDGCVEKTIIVNADGIYGIV